MALRYPIIIDGNEYEALLELPEKSDEPVVIPGYDLEADLAAAALGLEPTPAATLYHEWTDSLPHFLANENNFYTFLGLLWEQGLEVLGVDNDYMGDALSRTYSIVMDPAEDEITNKLDFEGFWETLRDRYQACGKLNWDQDIVREAAEEAVDQMLAEVFATIEQISKAALYELYYDRPRVTEEDDTHVTVQMDVRLYLFDNMVQSITIEGTKAFRDAELGMFEWEADASYSDAFDDIYIEMLEALGEETDHTELLKWHADQYVEEPWVPQPDYSGDYAVFIDRTLHGRFEDFGEAERFVDLAREVSDRENLGHDIRAYGLSEDVDPDDFEEDDMSNWEEMY